MTEDFGETELGKYILKNGVSRIYNSILFEKIIKDHDFLLRVSEKFKVLKLFKNSNQLNDHDFVKNVLKNQPLDLKYAQLEIKNDKEVLVHCVKKDFRSFEFAPKNYKDDFDIVMEFTKIDFRVFRYSSERIRSSPELMRQSVEKDKRFLQFICNPLKLKIDLFMDIINEDGHYVKYFHPSCITNEIWLIACKSSPTALKHIRGYFRMKYHRINTVDNEEFMKRAITLRGSNYYYASKEIQSKKEIALIAASNSGGMLKHMPEFQNDLEIVSMAIKNEPKSVNYASKELKDNKNLILQCIKLNPYSFAFASPNLKRNVEIQWMKYRYFKIIRDVNLFDLKFNFELK
jgi:hypothetical protein